MDSMCKIKSTAMIAESSCSTDVGSSTEMTGDVDVCQDVSWDGDLCTALTERNRSKSPNISWDDDLRSALTESPTCVTVDDDEMNSLRQDNAALNKEMDRARQVVFKMLKENDQLLKKNRSLQEQLDEREKQLREYRDKTQVRRSSLRVKRTSVNEEPKAKETMGLTGSAGSWHPLAVLAAELKKCDSDAGLECGRSSTSTQHISEPDVVEGATVSEEVSAEDTNDLLLQHVREVMCILREVAYDPNPLERISEIKSLMVKIHCKICRYKDEHKGVAAPSQHSRLASAATRMELVQSSLRDARNHWSPWQLIDEVTKEVDAVASDLKQMTRMLPHTWQPQSVRLPGDGVGRKHGVKAT